MNYNSIKHYNGHGHYIGTYIYITPNVLLVAPCFRTLARLHGVRLSRVCAAVNNDGWVSLCCRIMKDARGVRFDSTSDTHVRMHARTYTCTHTPTHPRTRAHTHTHAHAHTHTHTQQALTSSWRRVSAGRTVASKDFNFWALSRI